MVYKKKPKIKLVGFKITPNDVPDFGLEVNIVSDKARDKLREWAD